MCAELAGCSALAFLYRRSRAALNHGVTPHTPWKGAVRKESLRGGQRPGKHLPSDKQAVSFARSGHALCEHLLSGKPTFSFACGSGRFLHSRHSGVAARAMGRDWVSMYSL